MKGNRKGFIKTLCMTVLLCMAFTQEAAAAGSVSISASAESVEVAGEVSVTIKAENPEGSAEKPEISVEYDAAVLSFDSCDKETGGGGGGLITLADTEATIKFKGAASGTTEVKVSAVLDGDGANVPTDSVTIAVGDGVGTAGAAEGAGDTAGSNIADGLIAINGTEKMLSTTFPNEILPTSFHKADFTYQEQLLESAQFDMGDLTLLYVTDAGGANGEFCIYNQAADTFTDFVTINGIESKYIIIMSPDESVVVPDGFTKATLQWNGKSLQAYAITSSSVVTGEAEEGANGTTANGISTSDFFLLYALSSEGNQGWYLYDMKEGTYQRYLELDAAGAEEASVLDVFDSDTNSYKSQSHTRLIVICVMAVVMLVMIILLINLFLKLREFQSYEYIDEDEEEDDSGEDDTREYRSSRNYRNTRSNEHLSADEIRARRYEAGEDLEETGEINLEPVMSQPVQPYRQSAPISPVGYETQDMTFEDISIPEPTIEEDEEEEDFGRKKKGKKEKKKSRFAKWYEEDDFGDEDDDEDEDEDDEDDEEEYEERHSFFGRKKKKTPAPVEATQLDWNEMQSAMQTADEDERRPMSATRRPVRSPGMTVTEPPTPMKSRPVYIPPAADGQLPQGESAAIQEPTMKQPVHRAQQPEQLAQRPIQPSVQQPQPIRSQAQQLQQQEQPIRSQAQQPQHEQPIRSQAQQLQREQPIRSQAQQPQQQEQPVRQQIQQPQYEPPIQRQVQQPQQYEQPMHSQAQQQYEQPMRQPAQPMQYEQPVRPQAQQPRYEQPMQPQYEQYGQSVQYEQSMQPMQSQYEQPAQQYYSQPAQQQYYEQPVQQPQQQQPYYGQQQYGQPGQPMQPQTQPKLDLDDDFEFEFIDVDQ